MERLLSSENAGKQEHRRIIKKLTGKADFPLLIILHQFVINVLKVEDGLYFLRKICNKKRKRDEFRNGKQMI
ncbi:hypothetical protein [Desulfomarina sp.]